MTVRMLLIFFFTESKLFQKKFKLIANLLITMDAELINLILITLDKYRSVLMLNNQITF